MSLRRRTAIFGCSPEARLARWEKRLPEEVKRAAPPGSACPLFWPPARVGAAEAVSGSNLEAGLWSHVRQWPAVRAVRLALRVRQRPQSSATENFVLYVIIWQELRCSVRRHVNNP